MTSTNFERYDAAKAIIRAIRKVPALFPYGNDLDHPPQEDHASWVLTYEHPERAIAFSLSENYGGAVIITKSARKGYDSIILSQVGVSEPDVSTLTRAVVGVVLGQSTIPPESRRQVRDVLANARTDAEFHFRVGMDHILSTGMREENWAMLDDSDRWEFIVEAYATAAKVRPEMVTYMYSWRRIGAPLAIIDIYEDAYIERAAELVAGITGGAS